MRGAACEAEFARKLYDHVGCSVEPDLACVGFVCGRDDPTGSFSGKTLSLKGGEVQGVRVVAVGVGIHREVGVGKLVLHSVALSPNILASS